MPWARTGTTHYYAKLGLPDKGRAIEGLVVCNSWDLEPWVFINRLLRYGSYNCQILHIRNINLSSIT